MGQRYKYEGHMALADAWSANKSATSTVVGRASTCVRLAGARTMLQKLHKRRLVPRESQLLLVVVAKADVPSTHTRAGHGPAGGSA